MAGGMVNHAHYPCPSLRANARTSRGTNLSYSLYPSLPKAPSQSSSM